MTGRRGSGWELVTGIGTFWAIVAIGAVALWALRLGRLTRTTVLLLLLGGFIACSLAALEWSQRWFRRVVVVSVLGALALALVLGRQERIATRRREQREAASALDARRAAFSAATQLADKVKEAETAIKVLCSGAGGTLTGNDPHGCAATDRASDADLGAAELAVVRARADFAVADLEAASAPSARKAARLGAARRALAGALGATRDPAPIGQAVDALVAAGQSLARGMPVLGDASGPVELGVAGWTVLLGLLLAWYRWLEAKNSDQGTGVVTIDDLAGGDEAGKADRIASFRTHVLANVPEPGAVPGSGATLAITDLLDAKDPVSSVVAKVLKIVQAIVASAAGYEVDGTYRHVEAGGRGPGSDEVYEVFVRVRLKRTKATLHARTVTGDTAPLALRTAGYTAAAVILARDTTAPSWAAWSEDAADALAACDEAKGSSDQAAREKLEEALHSSPNSGLLLARLANAYDLEQRYLDALELHLRAINAHRRYFVARYRVSVSLANIASDVGAHWPMADVPRRRRVVSALGRAGATCRAAVDVDPLRDATDEQVVRLALLDAAEAFRVKARRLVRQPWVAANAFRRSERRVWAPMLAREDGRRLRMRSGATIDAGGHALRARRDDAAVPESAAERAAASGWWQAVYNVACAHAINAAQGGAEDRERAVALLEQLRELDGAGQLRREWVDNDPDLEAVRGDQRFLAFREGLRSTTDDDGGDDDLD